MKNAAEKYFLIIKNIGRSNKTPNSAYEAYSTSITYLLAT